MQLETLKVFCDVVKTSSFSKAAILNYISQSAVSQQMRSLEEKYDHKLIERFDDGSVELYDLNQDIGETDDLAAKMPARAAHLRDRLQAWRKATGAALPRPRKPGGNEATSPRPRRNGAS